MLHTQHARPTSEDGPAVEYAPFSGNMNHGLEIAMWAKGRLKGGPGNFVIEVPAQGEGEFGAVANPGEVLVKSVDGTITVLTAPQFKAQYEIMADEEETE